MRMISLPFSLLLRLRAAALVALVWQLGGCATVPEIEVPSDQPGALPRVIGAHGPLNARQVKALLDRLAAQGRQADLLARHLAVEQSVAERPLVAGNKVRLLRDGGETFAALFAAIRKARQEVDLEYYILEDVESGGQRLGDLLLRKRQQGVRVNIIYDSYGSMDTPAEFFDRLQAAGVNMLDFNPVNPLDVRNGSYSPNDRDHRKLLVVDGATAILGGVNLSTNYQSRPSHPSGLGAEAAGEHWRDTDVQIEGPAVAQLRSLFMAHWIQQDGRAPPDAAALPPVAPQGGELVRIIGSRPDEGPPRYYATLLSAIRTAQRRIWLTAAYFVPTHQEREDLIDAARRGVDVRLLLPSKSDSSLAMAVQHSHYEDLLEAHVQIYETRNEYLHSKTAVIDGVWSVVGSSNFDHRSVIFNDEVDAVLLGTATANQLESMFEQDCRAADRIDRNHWHQPVDERIEGLLARLWQSML